MVLLIAAATLTAPSVTADHCYGAISVGDTTGNTDYGNECHYYSGIENTGSILVAPIEPSVAETETGYGGYLLDSDGDGLTDGAELEIYGTDPYSWDTDGDGSGDGWEVANGYDPLTYNIWLN